jgi:drug/metabolite transporter (DMT)-like permease
MFANILILLALSLAWATNYVFIAKVDKALPPLTATAAITLVAAAFLFVGVRVIMRRPLWPVMRVNPWVPLMMAATCRRGREPGQVSAPIAIYARN